MSSIRGRLSVSRAERDLEGVSGADQIGQETQRRGGKDCRVRAVVEGWQTVWEGFIEKSVPDSINV